MIERDQAKRLAQGLKNNTLLREMIDARAAEIIEAWESELEPGQREQHWQQLKATNDLKDFIYARIDELCR